MDAIYVSLYVTPVKLGKKKNEAIENFKICISILEIA